MRARFTFTNSTQLADQLNPGDPYDKLCPVITLVICTFVLIGEDDHYSHRFCDYDRDHDIRFTTLRELRTLELPKLRHDDGTDLWDWLRLIAAETEEEIDMAVRSNPDLREAADLVKEFSADEARRHAARAHQRYLCDQATLESHAREQGRHEAISTVAQSMPVEQVADIFGITPDEVTAIVQAR
ncbi:MAG: Rpn family recombination-promoting nuclease/putative transposase [Micrococcales bacterium]|nr:Rpn family recombination-promoting nuclease/putative transposase [Micrococcales bacterium]